MARVDEIRGAAAGLLSRLEGRVVSQVRGDVHVGAAGPHRVELVITGAAEHGHARDLAVGVAGDPQSTRRRGEHLAQPACELSQRQRCRQLADPPSGIPFDLGESTLGGEPQRVREHPTHPGVRDVGVGVRDVEGDIGEDEAGHARALGAGRRDRVDATEQERVVRHEQVRAPDGRLLDDGERGVEGEQDAPDGLVEIPGHQADPVPGGRTGRRVERLETGDDVTQHKIFHVGPAGLEPTTPAV